jgi:hypothetical protein
MIESATVSFNQVAGLRLAREAKEDEDRHLDQRQARCKVVTPFFARVNCGWCWVLNTLEDLRYFD